MFWNCSAHRFSNGLFVDLMGSDICFIVGSVNNMVVDLFIFWICLLLLFGAGPAPLCKHPYNVSGLLMNNFADFLNSFRFMIHSRKIVDQALMKYCKPAIKSGTP